MQKTVYIWIFFGAIILVTLFSAGILFFYSQSETVEISEKSEDVPMSSGQSEVLPTIDQEDEVQNILDPFSVVFVGDMMLGRYVETLMNQKGSSYPFEKISAFFYTEDYVIGNLEGPIVTNHVQTPNYTMRFSFDPLVSDVLKQNHIDLVSLANNHALDQGSVGFDQSQIYLDQSKVSYVGHPSLYDDQYVFKQTIFDKDFVFFGFESLSSFDREQSLSMLDRHVSDETFDVVMIHWGNEYQLSSHISQKNLAYEFIEHGADLIIGHHPHVTQEVEVYQGAPIFYSLGNFIFDQYFSNDVQEGLVVKVLFEENEIQYHLLPVDIVRSQPRFMNDDSSQVFLENLSQRSSGNIQNEIAKGFFSIVNK